MFAKLQGIRVKLVALLLMFGLLPAVVIGVLFQQQRLASGGTSGTS
jgi:uncharacterized membrane-anchored protein YitT (DUF2179 family)